MMRLVAIWVAAACTMACVALGQQPSPPSGTSGGSNPLDQQLLEGLDRELLEGLPAPAERPPAAGKSGKAASNGPALPAGEDLGAPAESQNPLAQIAARMRTVEGRIAAGDTSKQTLAEQQQILAQLAALLDQAKKQGAGSARPGSGSRGGQGGQAGEGGGEFTPGPAQDSTQRIEQGTPEAAQEADVRSLVSRIWGHLPDKVRSEMQASLSEQFLPKYERLIEEYYKRLAELAPPGP